MSELTDTQIDLLSSPWKNKFRHKCGYELDDLPDRQYEVCPQCGEMFWVGFKALAVRFRPDSSREEKVLEVENTIENFIQSMEDRTVIGPDGGDELIGTAADWFGGKKNGKRN